MEIQINKVGIYETAASLTGRIARSSTAYGEVAITPDNYPMLDIHLSAGVADLLGALRRKIRNSDIDINAAGGNVTISLQDKLRMDPAVKELIVTNTRLYLVYFLAIEWLRPTAAKDRCSDLNDLAIGYLKDLISAINQRATYQLGQTDYSERNDEHNTLQGKGCSADYSERNAEHNTLQGNGGSADYSERNAEHNTLQGNGGSADYSERNGDSLTLDQGSAMDIGVKRRNADNVIIKKPGTFDGQFISSSEEAILTDEDGKLLICNT